MTQISTWTESFNEVQKEILNKYNLKNIPLSNQISSNDKCYLLRIEPLKWWLIQKEYQQFEIDKTAILDLSHSRTHIKVSGDKTTEFLKRFFPIDLNKDRFKVNSLASTSFHHVSITLWRSNNYYEMLIPRAFALSIWEILLEGASQFGYEIR